MKILPISVMSFKTSRTSVVFAALFTLLTSTIGVSLHAQEVTARQILEAQLAAAGVAVDGSGATGATVEQFKAAVLAAIRANPNRADDILIEALKLIRDRLVPSFLDNQGRYDRDALIDLFKSAVASYGPQNRPSDEARERLEEMLRAAYELFPELIGDFREAIDDLLTEDLRAGLDDLISTLVGTSVSGVASYFTMSNPGNVGGSSSGSVSTDADQDEPQTSTSGGGGGTGTTPATPVVP